LAALIAVVRGMIHVSKQGRRLGAPMGDGVRVDVGWGGEGNVWQEGDPSGVDALERLGGVGERRPAVDSPRPTLGATGLPETPAQCEAGDLLTSSGPCGARHGWPSATSLGRGCNTVIVVGRVTRCREPTVSEERDYLHMRTVALLMALKTPHDIGAVLHDMMLMKAVETASDQVHRHWVTWGRRWRCLSSKTDPVFAPGDQLPASSSGGELAIAGEWQIEEAV
jgi:hypothetical protein